VSRTQETAKRSMRVASIEQPDCANLPQPWRKIPAALRSRVFGATTTAMQSSNEVGGGTLAAGCLGVAPEAVGWPRYGAGSASAMSVG
jgi:hypothetical protein